MSAVKPEAIAVSYLMAVERKDRAAARELLSDDGAFVGPLQSFTEADAFMKAADVFMHLTKKYEIKKVLSDGNDVCVFWDYTTIVPSIPIIPIAQWFKIENGRIRYLHLHFNPTSIVAAMESGEIAKVLRR